MAISFVQAQDNLAKLIEWYSEHVNEGNRNEATTRLHLIDRLLFECLGWDKENCEAEESYGGKYTDYSLSCPERLLIVEAKKEGVYFDLPAGSHSHKYSIDYFRRHSPIVSGAIQQGMGYCQARGAPFGAVSNGHQHVAFIASRNDGHPPLQGQALVFHSLDDLSEHFLLAWNCLSRKALRHIVWR